MKRKIITIAGAAGLIATCLLLAVAANAQDPYANYRCGHDNKKVQICHIPPGNPENAHEICVGESAVQAHLAHGDRLGMCVVTPPPPTPIVLKDAPSSSSADPYENYRCGNDDKKVLVCHIPPGNPDNAHEICIGEEAVPAHLDHGDKLGSCVSTPPPPTPLTGDPGKDLNLRHATLRLGSTTKSIF
ncbi:hypothetical protein ACTHGU_12035 [Chitinophagaceae bacterium MMS25-I14]